MHFVKKRLVLVQNDAVLTNIKKEAIVHHLQPFVLEKLSQWLFFIGI